MNGQEILSCARRVLTLEARAIENMVGDLNEEFVRAVDYLYHCRGKAGIMGMGKSGLVGRKIASTLASTGTPSFFLHPAEGTHGDLGMLAADDVVIIISYSGETEEIRHVLPSVKRLGIPIITISGRPRSFLARQANVALDIGVREEACTLGLAPTSSTTATLALGDALAISLLERRGFGERDFAFLHPGGILGRRLLLRVRDLMHAGDEMPLVDLDTAMMDTIYTISSKGLGVTGVLDGEGRLQGVITDGDLRRAVERYPDLMNRRARDIMSTRPKWIIRDALAAEALRVMENHEITSLFVFESDPSEPPLGILHLHDILKAGLG